MARIKSRLAATFGAVIVSRCFAFVHLALAVVAIMPAAGASAQYDDSRLPPWQRPPLAAQPTSRVVADNTVAAAPGVGASLAAETVEPGAEVMQSPSGSPLGPQPGGRAMPVASSANVLGEQMLPGGSEGGCVQGGEECDPSGAATCEPLWKPLAEHVGADVEYLHWWLKGADAPPLVTTSPPGTLQNQAGVLSAAGNTTVLFGGSGLDGGGRSGGRVTLDYWFDNCENFALEASWLMMENRAAIFSALSTGTPILARPFVDVNPVSPNFDGPNARLLAYPGAFTGGVTANDGTALNGAEVLGRSLVAQQCGDRLDFLWGYRYLSLVDNLLITDSSTSTAANVTTATTDSFVVSNAFNGFEIGFKGQMRQDRWSLDLLGKLGLGDMRSVVDINGGTTSTTPGVGSASSVGGLLAQRTNIGEYVQDQFAVVPELGLKLHYDVTPQLQVSVGYTMLYLSKVARAAEQVDEYVNSSQSTGGTLNGLPRPAFNFVTNDFWAQGLDVGLQYRF